MWYWRESSFKTLKDVAAEASKTAEWADYAEYCVEQDRGLRRQALKVLDRFISRLKVAPLSERQKFVSWLFHISHARDGEHLLMPYPLRKQIVEPTLSEWSESDPTASEPHRWLGGYDHLKHAIQLNPFDEIARRKFIDCILQSVEQATHELPFGYLGSPHDDLALLREAETALLDLPAEDERNRIAARISEERKWIEGYNKSREK